MQPFAPRRFTMIAVLFALALSQHAWAEEQAATPEPVWFSSKEVDERAQPLQSIEPEYPAEALKKKIEGEVKLALKINARGVVEEAQVLEAKPPGVFEASARAVFLAARFAPAVKDGHSVQTRIVIRVEYRLPPEKPKKKTTKKSNAKPAKKPVQPSPQ